MRKGEFLGLTIDAVVQIGSAFWLRIPVGKMHTDRYVPLHPQLKTLLDAWLAERADWQSSDLLFTDAAARSRSHASPGPCDEPPPPLASDTSILISCATPWPPRPSTAG